MADNFELFASAFLGFLSVLAVEFVWSYIQKRKERKELLHDIFGELKKNRKNLLTLTKKENMIYTQPYETIIWEGASSSQALSSLRGYRHYYRIVKIYWFINSANSWEKMKTDVYFTNKSSPEYSLLSSEVTKQRTLIMNEIDNFLKLTGEG